MISIELKQFNKCNINLSEKGNVLLITENTKHVRQNSNAM